jgi:UDP-glucose:(heptosyl)LPS alpha-1,3-glucosyltransferase
VKVALIRQSYRPNGGQERFMARLVPQLVLQGVQPVVIGRDWSEGGFDGLAEIISLNPTYMNRLQRDRGFCRAVQSHLAATAYTLVQGHERIPGVEVYRAGDGVHANWVKTLCGRRRLLRPNWHPYHRYTIAAEDAMYRHPHFRRVICNSRMIEQQVLKRNPHLEGRTTLIRNGLDPERFNPSVRIDRDEMRARFGVEDGASVALFVGSGFWRKGLDLSIEALAGTGAHLWVVGSDSELDQHQARAQELLGAGRVCFFGMERDPRPHFGAADFFVMPARYDPAPNGVLEALACGLPVVTSNTTGSAEFMEGADAPGIVVETGDEAALSRAMRDIIDAVTGEDGYLWHERAYATAAPWTIERTSRDMATLYARLLTQDLTFQAS